MGQSSTTKQRIKDIRERLRALRMSELELAVRSKKDKATVWRTLRSKTEPLASTVEALEAAMIGAEIETLDRLIKRHGCRLIRPLTQSQLETAGRVAA